MRVLLSIKPEFAEKIFSGEKTFEFRKAIFKNKEVKTIVVYASSPLKQVIGEFEVEDIIKDRPQALWKRTREGSGISAEFFSSYFLNRQQAYAIKVKSYKRYDSPLCIKKDFNVKPPQSFLYLKDQ